MTKIPVVWLNLNPDAPNRGYWNQGLLEDLFNRKLWRVPQGFEYQHFDSIPKDCKGAIVVVPGQQNADYIAEINSLIEPLNWVLFVTGDEESKFPVDKLQHHNITIWTTSPNKSMTKYRALGFGYPQGVKGFRNDDKWVPWFFSGQVTHPRREQCVKALRTMTDGELAITPGFAQGRHQEQYWVDMSVSKIVPCPGGPVHLDSFRLYEALELGCIPLADSAPGYGDPDPDYYRRVFGVQPPFPVIHDWARAPEIINNLLEDWPRNANRVFAFWQNYKRKLSYMLDRDVATLTRVTPKPEGITILMPTSPIPSHPETYIIEETIESVRERLPDSEILIMIDGCRSEQKSKQEDYAEYTRRLLWLCNNKWTNILPLVFDEHLHQAVMTKRALEYTMTPFVMFVEHDTPLIGEIPFDSLTKVISSGQANVIRLHHEANVLEPHEYLMLDKDPQFIYGVPLLRTVQWSQRPHVASTEFYNWMMSTYFGEESRTMIEDLIYGVVETHWREQQEEGWEKFKLWMYAPAGNIKRSTHTDGRSGELKYSMKFAYDGETPQWAPFPGEIG